MRSTAPLLRLLAVVLLLTDAARAAPDVSSDQLQPFAAQARRVAGTLALLGEPLAPRAQAAVTAAAPTAAALEQALDARCLWSVRIPAAGPLAITAGAVAPELVAQGWRVFLVKVLNERGTTERLRVTSAAAQSVSNADAVRSESDRAYRNRRPHAVLPSPADAWLDLDIFEASPMSAALSGLPVEYRAVELSSRDAGAHRAAFAFELAAAGAPLGPAPAMIETTFRAAPARTITLGVRDESGNPTTAAFVIRDALGRIYPSLGKRVAPDFAFQPQVYRADGETVQLPDGTYTLEFHRGPESLPERRTIEVTSATRALEFRVRRWIDPAVLGWWSGDHHIHAAGCAHYSNPTEGVRPADMIRHIEGEDLKVGATLTWGPGFAYQEQFFTGAEDAASRYPYILRYDIEVSGFGSHRSGHLCLLGLRDEHYPGTTSTEHWPTLGLNTIRWAKAQGAIVGPAHSGWGLQPAVEDEKRPSIVQNAGVLRLATNDLPNYVIPPYNGIGANEYIVDVTHDVAGPDGRLVPAVDFMALADTPATWELNMWYHTLNAGFRTRVSGETDFPCIYGERVGVGRSYAKLDGKLTYAAWCESIRAGRCYVSDGKSHLFDFAADDAANGAAVRMGEQGSELRLAAGGRVHFSARVAARLDETPDEPIRRSKWTEKPYWDLERARIGNGREVAVELIVNGYPAARQNIVADGALRTVQFDVPIERSSWAALRILPSSHTNPIWITIAEHPVRASRRSLAWCLAGVDRCWSQKERFIAPAELAQARADYQHARDVYRQRLGECEAE